MEPHKTTRKRLTDSQIDNLGYELEVAREIQSWLLPKKLPQIQGYDFDACYDPAEDIAGDYYDFIEHGGGAMGLVVADACGKGIPAALLMVHTRGLMRLVARDADSPADVLRLVNAAVMEDLRAGTIVTAIYAKLIPSRRMLQVASAGHLPMLVLRPRTKEALQIHPAGMPLGSAAPLMFDRSLEQVSFVLEPGDRFVMFTDGANEMRDPEDNEFGLDQLAQAALEYAAMPSSDFTACILAALRDHRREARRADDVTIVTGRLSPDR